MAEEDDIDQDDMAAAWEAEAAGDGADFFRYQEH